MPAATLTDKLCFTAPPTGPVKFFDTEIAGLYAYISAKRVATFSYKFGNPQRTLPVEGTFTTIKDVRKACRILIGDLAKGTRTVETVRTQLANDTLTFKVVADLWLKSLAGTRSERSCKNLLSNLQRPLAAFGDKRIGDVTVTDVKKLVTGIAAEGHKSLANTVRTVVHSVFKYAVGEEIVQINPVKNLSIAREKLKDKDRFLRREELKAFWAGLDRDDLPCDRRTALVYKLILCTALRPGEVLLARRSEIKAYADEDGGDGKLAYRNPGNEAGRSKKARAIIQPLNSLAQEVIAELLTLPTKDDLLIPPGAKGARLTTSTLGIHLREVCAFLGFTQPVNDAIKGGAPFSPFSPHVLRHTPATQLGLGWKERGFRKISNGDIGRCLDHIDTGHKTTRIYNVADQVEQTELRRETLDHLDGLLRAIVGQPAAAKVVRLKVA